MPLFLRRSRVANFADMIKIATILVKKIFKDSKKFNELKLGIKIQSISVFLSIKKC